MNNLVVSGHVGNDPEIKITQSGTPIMNINLAVREYKNGKEGTLWVRLVAWDKMAERLDKLGVEKGWFMVCQGTAQVSAWTDRQGVAQATLELVLRDFDFKSKGARQVSDEEIDASFSGREYERTGK